VAVSAAMVIAGLIAKELGGERREQILAAVATCVAPVALAQGAVFQYVSFDYLWGVLATYFLVKLGKSGDARWWLAIGFTLGLGMETRYTAGFWTLGIVGGVLVTDARNICEQMALAGRWHFDAVAFAECDLAGAASFYFFGFLEAFARTRCAARSRQRISGAAALVVCECGDGAAERF